MELAPRLLAAGDVAKLYGIGVRSVYRWSADGRIPRPIHFGRRKSRWRLEDVERDLRRRKTG